MITIARWGLCAMAVMVVTVVSPVTRPASAFPNRTVVVHPVILQTFVAGMSQEDEWTCGTFSCFGTGGTGVGTPLLADPFRGRIAVGYDVFADPGTKPCACQRLGMASFRAAASFRTDDIPGGFVSATLVLTPLDVDVQGRSVNPNLLRALYDLRIDQPDRITFADPSRVSLGYHLDRSSSGSDRTRDVLTVLSGRVGRNGMTSFPAPALGGDPVIDPFPAETDANSFPVQRAGHGYRIDVSQTVRRWVADWEHRLEMPLHGFLLVGEDFTSDVFKTTKAGVYEATFLVQYAVTIEFVIHEPDL